jgi:hypothetical protein
MGGRKGGVNADYGPKEALNRSARMVLSKNPLRSAEGSPKPHGFRGGLRPQIPKLFVLPVYLRMQEYAH